MEFFDEALNKAKDVFDVACKKTEEVVTSEKQRFDISLLKSKREKDYAILGKLYYQSVKDAELPDGKEKDLVEEIRDKTAKIDELTAEFQNAKNRDVCPACGAGVAKNSTYCHKCGAKMGD